MTDQDHGVTRRTLVGAAWAAPVVAVALAAPAAAASDVVATGIALTFFPSSPDNNPSNLVFIIYLTGWTGPDDPTGTQLNFSYTSDDLTVPGASLTVTLDSAGGAVFNVPRNSPGGSTYSGTLTATSGALVALGPYENPT